MSRGKSKKEVKDDTVRARCSLAFKASVEAFAFHHYRKPSEIVRMALLDYLSRNESTPRGQLPAPANLKETEPENSGPKKRRDALGKLIVREHKPASEGRKQ